MIRITLPIRLSLECLILLCSVFGLSEIIVAKDRHVTPECVRWIKRIDPNLGKATFALIFPISEKDTLLGMKCYLMSEGNRRPSRIDMNMSFNGGTRLPAPRIELAALYFVSYLFEENWEHSVGIALQDRKGRINPRGSVHIAYKAYEVWFKKVQEIGLEKARRLKLDPFAGSEIQWFGA